MADEIKDDVEKLKWFKHIAYETSYGLNIINITDYLAIYGMFEIKNGSRYEIYEAKNEDSYTWKK